VIVFDVLDSIGLMFGYVLPVVFLAAILVVAALKFRGGQP
jgi:hypothetical protein